MRRLLLTVSLTIAALSLCMGLGAQERLSTTKYSDASDGYYRQVERLLGVNLNRSMEWGYVVRPSFFNEYALCCFVDDFGAELVYTVAKESIWSSKNRNAVQVDTYRLRIKRSVAESLTELFKLAVETSDFLPDKESFSIYTNENGDRSIMESMGEDGTSYIFFSDGRAAQCWSPKESNCSNLVHIADNLCPAVKKGDKDAVQEIASGLSDLKESFRSLLPDWYNEYLDVKAEQNARK